MENKVLQSTEKNRVPDENKMPDSERRRLVKTLSGLTVTLPTVGVLRSGSAVAQQGPPPRPASPFF